MKLWTFEINQSKTSLEQIKERYEYLLVDAIRKVLNLPNLNTTVHFINSPKKIVTVEWFVDTERCDYPHIRQQTNRKDFEPRLICELAKVDGGSFGTFLNRGKQLTIVNEGWSVLEELQNSLLSKGGKKEKLLALPTEDRFDEEVVEVLYKVSEDSKGNALRGSTVCCARFKLLQDIWKMREFVKLVKPYIQRSTMIVSLKKDKQYKGWSLYLDVGSEQNVQGVMQLANRCNFKRTEVFVAVENQRMK